MYTHKDSHSTNTCSTNNILRYGLTIFFPYFPGSFPTFKYIAGRLPCLGQVYVKVDSWLLFFQTPKFWKHRFLGELTQSQKNKEELVFPSARVEREPPGMNRRGGEGGSERQGSCTWFPRPTARGMRGYIYVIGISAQILNPKSGMRQFRIKKPERFIRTRTIWQQLTKNQSHGMPHLHMHTLSLMTAYRAVWALPGNYGTS